MTFDLWPEQQAKVYAFVKRHSRCAYGAAIGGAITYEFTPTTIATVVKVRCARCGEQEDASDYEA